jgi:membrane-associated protein
VPVDTLVGICALAAPATVALVLVAEAGLLIGIVLPAGSLVLGLGVLAGVGVVSLPLVALTVAVATVLGAALGHRAVRRASGGELLVVGGVLGRRLPGRATRLIDRTATPCREAIGRRPVRAAATAQFIVGARTLAPRLAASAGVPLATMLRGTAPAALVWSSALVTTGALAGAALPLIRDLLTVAGIPLALAAATWLLVRRRVRQGAVDLTGCDWTPSRIAEAPPLSPATAPHGNRDPARSPRRSVDQAG